MKESRYNHNPIRSRLARRVVYSDKELYSTLSLVTQVYKWVPATYC